MTTRSQFPVTNLKERIAALEQRNAESAASVQRATSPTPSPTSNSSPSGPSNGALRDRIARFEKKGGVPVPRGRFGLGAPPLVEGPRKRGELYGNRIPVPSRTVSNGTFPLSRPGSMATPYDQRRSFSTSSVISDFDDDHLDYSPISSPAMTLPLDSPDSVTSVSITPDISPSLSDFPNPKQHIARGTSFAQALDVARKAESEKQGRQNSTTLASRSRPLSEDDGHPERSTEMAPTIVISSEGLSPVLMPESPTVYATSVPSTTPRDGFVLETVQPNEELSYKPPETFVANGTSPVITTVTQHVAKEVARVGTPPLVIRKRTLTGPSTPFVVDKALKDPDINTVPVEPQVLESPSPQGVEFHDAESHERGTLNSLSSIQPKPVEVDRQVPSGPQVLESPSPQAVKLHDAGSHTKGTMDSLLTLQPKLVEVYGQVPSDPQVLESSSPQTVKLHDAGSHKKGAMDSLPSIQPNPVEVDKQVPSDPQVLESPSPKPVALHDASAWISDSHTKGTMDSLPSLHLRSVEPVLSENIELRLNAPETLPILPPPDIVVPNEQSEQNVQELNDAVDEPSINSNAGVRSRKVALTLDSGPLNDGSLMSAPLQSGHILHWATTAPPGAPESFPSPNSFLSPPGTGLHFGSPSSGGSSLSSLGSRPMSMFETSPKLVTQMLRMTPATSRGIPMFLPANHGPSRKSDFVYFPPTPEDEDTDISTMQNSSHSNRMRSGSDPEDPRSMPAKQTFTAVVHRKVRETPVLAMVPGNNIRPLPQTPQPQRVKRATILETPLSPGHGELAALLQEAVLLENTLNKGELPSENPQVEEKTTQMEKRAKETAAAAAQVKAKAKAKAEVEERGRLALATAQLQSKRDEPTAGRLKHTFLVPLSKARSQHRKQVYTAAAEAFFSTSEEPSSAPPIQPKSAGLPSQSAANSFATASAAMPKMPATQPTVDVISSNSTIQLPTKSPKSPRFSSLRKFGSISRGERPSERSSHSTSSEISSEESSSALSPENSSEFGHGGSTLSFPSVSPKKSSTTIARATSFAEKLWSRGRTKSSGSTLSSTSEVNDRAVDVSPGKTSIPRIPAIGSPPPIDLPHLPRHPVTPPLSFDDPGQITPLRRSTSSKRSAVYFSPGPDFTAVPQLPPVVSAIQIHPETSSSSLFLSFPNESIRPSSANSISSAGSLPSPLFGQELVDAFPSVPGTTPTTTIGHKFPHREMTLATPSTAAFDTALMSSAIHLSSSHKQATPKASLRPLPSERAATPTSTSYPSGGIVR